METENGPKVGDYMMIFYGKGNVLQSGVIKGKRYFCGSDEYYVGEGWYDYLPEYGDRFIAGEIYNTKMGKLLWDTKSGTLFD